MARTLYFPDGSHEVILCAEQDTVGTAAALERILRERLGNDTAALFHQLLHDDPQNS